MGAHLIFFIIFTLFSCIILTNQSLPWSSLRSGFQCDTKMAAVFSCMRPERGTWLNHPQSMVIDTYTPPHIFFCFIRLLGLVMPVPKICKKPCYSCLTP